MVEHVNMPWPIFSRFPFLGSEDKATSATISPRSLRQ